MTKITVLRCLAATAVLTVAGCSGGDAGGAGGGAGGGGEEEAPATTAASPGGDTGADGGTDTGAGTADAAALSGPIAVEGFRFEPKVARVAAGDSVTWAFRDPAEHSVVADDGSFESANLGQGAEFTHRFDTAGRFDYFCGIHNSMTGTIVVE